VAPRWRAVPSRFAPEASSEPYLIETDDHFRNGASDAARTHFSGRRTQGRFEIGRQQSASGIEGLE